MTISKDTPLEEILLSSKLIDSITEKNQSIQSLTSNRSTILNTEMTGGLSKNTLVDGEPLFYDKANIIKDKYDLISSNFEALTSNIINTSINKEYDELSELKTQVQKYIFEQNSIIMSKERELSEKSYNNTLNEEEANSSQQEIENLQNEVENYKKKLEEINKRLSMLEKNENIKIVINKDCYYNEIPEDLKEAGYPDIYIDKAHVVDFKGWWIFDYMNNNRARGDEGYHFVYYPEDDCYYEINEDLNNTTGAMPYENIPEGESPQQYGYTPRSVKDLETAKITD